MESSQTECKVLHVGQGNPQHKHRLGRERMENSSERDLGVLVNERLDMSHQKPMVFWAASKAARAAGQGRDSPLLFCSYENPPGELHPAGGLPP